MYINCSRTHDLLTWHVVMYIHRTWLTHMTCTCTFMEHLHVLTHMTCTCTFMEYLHVLTHITCTHRTWLHVPIGITFMYIQNMYIIWVGHVFQMYMSCVWMYNTCTYMSHIFECCHVSRYVQTCDLLTWYVV